MTYVGFVTSQWYCVPFKTLLISYYGFSKTKKTKKAHPNPQTNQTKNTTKLSVQKMAIQSCAFIQVPSQIKLLCILTISSVDVKPAGSSGYRWVCWGKTAQSCAVGCCAQHPPLLQHSAFVLPCFTEMNWKSRSATAFSCGWDGNSLWVGNS